MAHNIFYTSPFQVRYWRPDINSYSYGIAFKEHVVDVKDGTVFSIYYVIDCAPCSEDDAIIEYCDWKDLSKDFNKK